MQITQTTLKPQRNLSRLIKAIPSLQLETQAAINGVIGDRLDRNDSAYATQMALYYGCGLDSIALDLNDNLDTQISHTSSSISIFVHGLMCTERIWGFPAKLNQIGLHQGYGDRLQQDTDTTAIYLRYNSGRHISDNGRELAELIEQLLLAWPCRVNDINIIGYSMGGLVSRSAAYYAEHNHYSWHKKLQRMFLLGTPLHGAPLEKFANLVTSSLKLIPTPVTRMIAHVLNQRSDGIKDLRHGYLRDEDWQDQDPDELNLHFSDYLPLPKHVEHYTIAGQLFTDEAHPGAKLFGDILVTPHSASGSHHSSDSSQHGFNGNRTFSRMHHLNLINDDDIYKQLLSWWQH